MKRFFIILLCLAFAMMACSVFTGASQDTMETSVAETVAARPTDAPMPSDTPAPTPTLAPTDTPLPSPSPTVPTSTPTEVPATDVPTLSHVTVVNNMNVPIKIKLRGPTPKSFTVNAKSTFTFDAEPGLYEYSFSATNFIPKDGTVTFPPGDFAWTWGKAKD